MTLRIPTSYTTQRKPRTEAQKAAKREYDKQRRASYAARRLELEQAPERREVRTAYLRGRRTKPQIAMALLVANAKYRAKKRGIEFTIAAIDLEMPSHCPVLGIPIEHGNGDQSYSARDCAPSLDRLDNSKGYVPGNVRVISWRANRLKSDGTIAELEAILKYMKGIEP